MFGKIMQNSPLFFDIWKQGGILLRNSTDTTPLLKSVAKQGGGLWQTENPSKISGAFGAGLPLFYMFTTPLYRLEMFFTIWPAAGGKFFGF